MAFGLTCTALLFPGDVCAQEVELIGRPVRGVPVTPAVKVARSLFVSGTPGYKDGKLATGDFSAQMKQVMENIDATPKSAGRGWDRVAKTNVILTKREYYDEMNRIYAMYFKEGKYPARTTVVVTGLPSPDFLLEIECEAIFGVTDDTARRIDCTPLRLILHRTPTMYRDLHEVACDRRRARVCRERLSARSPTRKLVVDRAKATAEVSIDPKQRPSRLVWRAGKRTFCACGSPFGHFSLRPLTPRSESFRRRPSSRCHAESSRSSRWTRQGR